MPSTDDGPISQSRSIILKDEPSPARRRSPEPSMRVVDPAISSPDAPKPKENIPESDSKAVAEPPDEPRPPSPELEPEEDKSLAEIVDMDVFGQILELDEEEDEDYNFSKPMVWEYFDQAEKTFLDMDEALEREDLSKLSQLGHFLKGSSAALGLARVRNTCEKIQHCGHKRDEVANEDLTPEEAMKGITKLLKKVKAEYAEVNAWLKNFYSESKD